MPTPSRPPSRSSRRAAPAAAKRRAPAKRPAQRRSFLWRWRRLLFVAGLLGFAAIAGFLFVLSRIELPPSHPLRQTSFICDAGVADKCGPGNAMAELHAEQDRVSVRLSAVPEVLREAVLSAEDKDFYRHGGVDPWGVARAAWADIRNKGSRQGGSTITQQYVKNTYLTSERTLTRKLKEAVLSIKIEQKLSKNQILERYLNTVYFGRGAYGVQAAATAYFGKNVGDLDLSEAAYLAGLIRSPETADAIKDPDTARFRRRTVLAGMVRDHHITAAQMAGADATPFEGHVLPRAPRQELGVRKGKDAGSEYFVEYVRRFLARRFGDATVYGGGLRVYTTLDLRMQQAAYDAVRSTLTNPDDPAAALVAIDDGGRVKAMVGGTDFAKSQVNLAVGRDGGGSGRQPGSSFKPFALAEAVKEGYSVRSLFKAPSQIVFPQANAGKDWKVKNYAGTDEGILDLVDATRVSSNTVYAQLMLDLGADKVVSLAERMGITAELPAVPSLVLGSGEVSVLDMASAYSTLADRGEHVDPVVVTRVERADGTVLVDLTPDRTRVLEPDQADTVTYCLRQVVQDGTGKGANFGRPAAGKTGTTEDNRDAWFVGYTPKLTAAVWMGYPGKPGERPRFMSSVHGKSVSGGTFPADMWRKFMRAATSGIDTGSFNSPRSLDAGVRLNKDLQTTTSTSSTSSTTTSSTSSTTTTTAPPTTTTTKPPPTTTTKPPPPSSSSTTSPPPSSTTTAGPLP